MDLFYNEFIKDASKGRVDCGMFYNILFNTSIIKDNKLIELTKSDSDLLVPTLLIKNKDRFDYLLNKYILLAREFYKDKKIDVDNYDKMLLATLFSNMLVSDFNNIEDYLNLRINFLLDKSLDIYKDGKIFYSDILKENILVRLNKNYPYDESYYSLNISITNGSDIYKLPSVRIGVSDNTTYIFSIQNEKQEKTDYGKRINRKLFMINDNFKDDSDNDWNLKDVSMSFVFVSAITLGILDKLGIKNIKITPLFTVRWNAKRIMFDVKEEFNRLKSNESTMDSDILNHDMIQSNLTDKFIRTFMRLMYHFSNIDVVSYPYELDDYFSLKINNNYGCNNRLLDEIYNLGRSFSNEKDENHIRR